jgi:hypothetical protein
MSESKSAYSLNLLILGIAIILVIVAYQNVSKPDSFVGKVPITSIGNGSYFGNYYGIPPGVYPSGQPMMYPQQFYPSKYPYYDDSIDQVGRPCDEANGCGVLGACMNGVCTVKDQQNTVFDIKL